MRDSRGPWYLLTGLAIGAVLGVLYAWGVQPVKYKDTPPASLRTDFKDQYRALIASAYMADGDLVRARARLDLLGDADVYQVLAEQAQRTLANASQLGEGAMQEARALGVLAVALGQPVATVAGPAQSSPSPLPSQGTPSSTPALNTLTPTPPALPATPIGISPSPGTSTVTAQSTQPTTAGKTPSPTITRLPTRTFTPTPGAPFALKSEELACNPDQNTPLIVLQTNDAAGQGVPGVEVVVSWDGGENHFFTGLKPELGLGYADFTMTPGVVYSLRLVEGGQIIPNLSASECEAADGNRYWGSWLLIFEQP